MSDSSLVLGLVVVVVVISSVVGLVIVENGCNVEQESEDNYAEYVIQPP